VKYADALHALMATKGRLEKTEVDSVLAKAGFDPAALVEAYRKDSARIDAIVARNMDQANAFGFNGTPAFIIGTKIFHGAMDAKALTEAVAQARAG
jgi:protein-disulfide isomerase